ncbi:hypothetical protein [Caulobacter segnis]|uniref:Uncharacterized protein n=1 Tax=Caulobacter segnis (strain ATCC 21756 / DSM 7131 / JCM 7823 / NBRC 15250 / LMG 17158 / TK0059) TaxID=509190 RepID=D5VIX4_CAUST|nr:hypothetical protein [Caulobacter segnis]ADG09940.1 conserved hypothetical protein [Caulobacter segnis ATCC 21756]
MERLEPILDRLKVFALTRPVAYGAPACAVAGLLMGLVLQTGPQDGPYVPEMERVDRPVMAEAEPIAWPSGEVPDYVIGTDAQRPAQTPPPALQYADYEPPPEPELPPHVPADHGPAAPPPWPDETRWASSRGDILDVSLPEDAPSAPTAPSAPIAPSAPTPTVLAGVAS